MGCDIHIICEVKKDGKWILNPVSIFPNHYYDPEEKNKPKEKQWKLALDEFSVNPDSGRNYDWFSVLANVRNGRGFAGCKTGEGFSIISEPKGVPVDASEDWINTVKEWDVDMHSHSYLHLSDFDNFDWNQKSIKTGIIPINKYKELRGTNKSPESWSGMISGGGIVVVSEKEADLFLEGKLSQVTKNNFYEKDISVEIKEDTQVYVSYNWTVLYSDWFEYKIKNTVIPMRELSKQFEDVRVVFGFDN